MKKQLFLSDIKPIYSLEIQPAIHNSVSDFIRYYKELDFDIVLSNGQKLQRDYVWDNRQREAFVKSMLLNVSVPPLYCVMFHDEFDNAKVKVVDGKQRLSTAIGFYNNEFPITVKGCQYFFNDFSTELQYAFAHRFSFNVHIVHEYHDQIISDKNMVQLFEMVNFAGTPQERDHIDALLDSVNMR